MRSVLVRGEVSAADLDGVFRSVAGEVQWTASYALGETRVALFVGQKYMLRTNDRVGVILLSAANGSGQRIDLSSAGGGSGPLGISWGAGGSIETELYDALSQFLQSRSLVFQEITSS